MTRHASPSTTPSTPHAASRRALAGAAGILTLALAACGSSTSTSSSASSAPTTTATASTVTATSAGSSPMASSPGMATASGSSMASMDANGSGAPAGIAVASHPRYPVGSHVVLTADHEMGMKGAKATVVGAYSTITYAVDYTPTTGGSVVRNHKWVVQQEIQDAGTKRLANGTSVVLIADHMTGMKGARATIVSSTTQTVYMVDWDMGGMTMRNHKWVVESEMRAAN